VTTERLEPVDAGQCRIGQRREVLERKRGQRLREAAQHRELEPLDVDLHEVRPAVARDQRVQRRHRHAHAAAPAHAAEGRRGAHALRPVCRQRGDRGVARADEQLGLALGLADRHRQHRHGGVLGEEPVQHAQAVGLRFDRHDPRAQPPPDKRAVAHVRADVEGEPARRHERPVKRLQTRAPPGDAVIDPHRAEQADRPVQAVHRAHAAPPGRARANGDFARR